MKAIALPLLAALTLAACSSSGTIINANPSSVAIEHDENYEAATEQAIEHCAQFDKDTRLIHSDAKVMSFDCIARD